MSVCGTNDAPAATIWGAESVVTSRSRKWTRPCVGRIAPKIAFSSVDLPAPLGPISVTISPAPISRSTSWMISTSP